MLEWNVTSFEEKGWEISVTKDSDYTSFYTVERLHGGKWILAAKGGDKIHRQVGMYSADHTLFTILPAVMIAIECIVGLKTD